MKAYMFKSRGGALFFVGATLLGAVTLVGTESTDGAIANTTAQIEQQRADFKDQVDEMSTTAPAPALVAEPSPTPEPTAYEDITFTPDEDLMVDPVGIDPTPIITDPAAGEVVVVESSADIVSD